MLALLSFRTAATAVLMSVLLGAWASADEVADCGSLAASVSTAHKAVLTMSSAASAQGTAALALAGTTRRYGTDYKTVEDNIAIVNDSAASALKASTDGLVVADGFTDPDEKSNIGALLNDYQKKATALQMYSHIALAYERAVNSKNRMSHLAAFDMAMAGMSRPTATTQSTTNGSATISGDTINGTASTTSTTTLNDPGTASREKAAERSRMSQDAEVSADQLYPTLFQFLSLVQNVPNALRIEEARVKRMCPSTDFGDPTFGT